MRFVNLRLGKWLLVLVAALLFAACSDSNEPDGDTQIRIVNASGTTIFRVFYSACDDADWGDDRLDSDEVIEDGDDRGFDVSEGCYDIRADLDVTGTPVNQRTEFGVEISDGEIHEFTVTE